MMQREEYENTQKELLMDGFGDAFGCGGLGIFSWLKGAFARREK